jgi:hypothetical protein
MTDIMVPGRQILVVAIAAASVACSAPSSYVVHKAPSEVRGTMSVSKPERRNSSVSVHSKRSAVGLVEESLHGRGVRFGTDGSVATLFAFIQNDFPRISAEQARDGDVVFFDTGTGCGGHVGLVESAEASGRIGFREWRDGSARHSFVTPNAPLVRRDPQGRILNTFLRTKQMEDPPEARYFAGEMLCAAFRVDTK